MATAVWSCGFSTTVMLMGSPFGDAASRSPFLRQEKLGTGSPFTFTCKAEVNKVYFLFIFKKTSQNC
jgi:hypothetical protein